MRKAAAQLGAYAAMALIAVLGVIALSSAMVATGRTSPRPARTSPGCRPCRPCVRARRFRRCCPVSTRCEPSWIRRTGTRTTCPGRCAGDCIRETRSAIPRATRICASSTARLLPFVAARFRQRLVQYGAEPEKLYEYLKAYLMLGQPRAPRQEASAVSRRPRMEHGERRQRRTGSVAVEAFSGPARSRRRPSSDSPSTLRLSRRRARPSGRHRFRGSCTPG